MMYCSKLGDLVLNWLEIAQILRTNKNINLLLSPVINASSYLCLILTYKCNFKASGQTEFYILYAD